MNSYGKAIVILGLTGIAGAVDTGCGWFTSCALIGSGAALMIFEKGKERLDEKKNFSRLVKRVTSVKLDVHGKRGPVHPGLQ